MNESNQIIELLNNEDTTFKNISYKSVNRTKLNNMNNNSFSNIRIRFSTKEISNHLVSYQDSYILLEVNLKFANATNAIPANIRLKNSYEMINSIMIELNRTIVSNEDYVYYSNIIPHLLENSKNDDLLYRGIDLHDKVTFETNTNKNIFLTNAGDTVTVKVPIYLKDISDYFRQLSFPLEFCDYNISIQVVDEIYYKADAINIESQTIENAFLYTDVCYLDEKTNLDYLKKIKFNKTIPIFDNNVIINNSEIAGNNFTIHLNSVYNCKNMYLMFIKNNSVIKIPDKSCSNIQLKVNSEMFQNVIENDLDAFLIFKNRSPFTNELLIDYNQFKNDYLIYSFPLDRMLKNDSGSKSIIINGNPVEISKSSAIIIYQQASYINFKIENGALIVTKTY